MSNKALLPHSGIIRALNRAVGKKSALISSLIYSLVSGVPSNVWWPK